MIGQASVQLGINDFKADAMRIMARYAILVTPVWAQDRNHPGDYWAVKKLVDSAAIGDVVAAQWRM